MAPTTLPSTISGFHPHQVLTAHARCLGEFALLETSLFDLIAS
jgi:hypothetical protein